MQISLKKHIENLLRSGDFKTVFDLLYDRLPDDQNILIIRQGGYNRLLNQVASGRVTETSEHFQTKIAEITFVLQQLSERLPTGLTITVPNAPLKTSSQNQTESSTTENQPPKTKKRILFISASPKDMGLPNVGRQLTAMHKAIKEARVEDVYEIKSLNFVLPQDLYAEISEYQPTFIHFFMHNHQQEGLYFEQGNGKIRYIEPSLLSEVLEMEPEAKIELVLLNACNTMNYAEPLAQIVHNTVYTTDFVPDEVANENNDTVASLFTYQFYKEVFKGRTFQIALKSANKGLKLSGMPLSDSNSKPIDQIYKIHPK